MLRLGIRRTVVYTAAMLLCTLLAALHSQHVMVFSGSRLHRLLHVSSALSTTKSCSLPKQASSPSPRRWPRTATPPLSPLPLPPSLPAVPPSIPSAASTGCNYTDGKWVKSEREPFYSGNSCKKWLSGMWACRLMPARTNFQYENFRWQPNGCKLPDFDSKHFLARMRNNVVAFVGDSLGMQQYQSLMCMLTDGDDISLVKDVSESYGLGKPVGAIRANGTAQMFITTNTTIIFYWSACLCELQPLNKSDLNTLYAMHLDRPATFIQNYLKVMDVLVLNTGHHWNRRKLDANKWVMHVNGKADANRIYERAILTARELTIHKVVAWLHEQKESNQAKAEIYFRSMSPRHFFGGEWNSGGRCDDDFIHSMEHNIIRPISDPVVERAIAATSLHLLNITHVSQLRYDGHISKYHSNKSAQDCSHWCLPGVPDVWNELLYADIISRGMKNEDAFSREMK